MDRGSRARREGGGGGDQVRGRGWRAVRVKTSRRVVGDHCRPRWVRSVSRYPLLQRGSYRVRDPIRRTDLKPHGRKGTWESLVCLPVRLFTLDVCLPVNLLYGSTHRFSFRPPTSHLSDLPCLIYRLSSPFAPVRCRPSSVVQILRDSESESRPLTHSSTSLPRRLVT